MSTHVAESMTTDCRMNIVDEGLHCQKVMQSVLLILLHTYMLRSFHQFLAIYIATGLYNVIRSGKHINSQDNDLFYLYFAAAQEPNRKLMSV